MPPLSASLSSITRAPIQLSRNTALALAVVGLRAGGTEANNPFRQLAETGREATGHILRNDDPTARPVNTAPWPQLHHLDVSHWVTCELCNSTDEFTAKLQGGMKKIGFVTEHSK